MSQLEIIEEIRKPKRSERFAVLQETVKLIGDDFTGDPETDGTQYLSLADAAKLMKADYEAGGDLTAFSVLDGEDVYEER